ncbi:hypothetical protein BB558_003735 [Smittium angustum]|uniref:MULE transposase domain-containing protein n=1 Tax=Smittium angustum TaxID=133377 RepID=A0A2U1J566_SMIAN|nr:hypothetical protein BB558_003735 [Smittium angustum]
MNYTEDENTPYIFSQKIESNNIKILLSIKNPMKLLLKNKNIQLDMTYKLTDLGNHVLVVGISNLERLFTPIIVEILTCESEKTILWIFKEVNSEFQNLEVFLK